MARKVGVAEVAVRRYWREAEARVMVEGRRVPQSGRRRHPAHVVNALPLAKLLAWARADR